MESLLAGKPLSQTIGALRGLSTPLREHWGNLEEFKTAGMKFLAQESEGIFHDEEKGPRQLEMIYRQTLRMRAVHFRAIENSAQLEHHFKELDQAASENNATFRQALLFLASRLQQSAIAYLGTAEAEKHRAIALKAVLERRDSLVGALGNLRELILDRVEAVLAVYISDVLGEQVGRFEIFALAGHMVEQVRLSARQPPEIILDVEEMPDTKDVGPLLGLLTEPVRQAELNEARMRYAQLNEAQKTSLYNHFRVRLQRVLKDVAKYAPKGFIPLCEAIESRIFPYPGQLGYIRAYLRPIYENASQSSIFTDANTPQSVQQRYDALMKSRKGNPFLLEIARAFAMRNFKSLNIESKRAYMREIDLKEEFGWPSTTKELLDAMN